MIIDGTLVAELWPLLDVEFRGPEASKLRSQRVISEVQPPDGSEAKVMTAHVYRCLCIRRRGNQPHTMDELIARLLVAHRLCMRRWARTSVLLLLALLLGCLGLSFFSLTSIRIAQDNASEMAALQPLKFLTVAARAKHTATVIFVHVRLPHLSKNASLTVIRDLAML